MNLWICLLCATITSISFQGCMVNAQQTVTSCTTDPKCVSNSSHDFSSCTPKPTCSEPNTTCPNREFNFTKSSLYVWLNESIDIKCEGLTLDVFGDMSNKTNRTVPFKKSNHGKRISCYDMPSKGGTTSNSTATVYILMTPAADVTRQTFLSHGGPVTMKLNFEANPQFVTKDNVTIKYKNSTVTKFFYGNNGLTHEILLYFKEVTAQNEGEYIISVVAANSQCLITPLVMVGVLGKALHIGWIVSIGLGAFSFLLMVVVIVCTVSRCRNRSENGRSKIEMKSTRPVVDSIPVNGLHQQAFNSQTDTPRAPVSAPSTQLQFPRGNPSYNRYSEDEFESDSDEEGVTTSTLDNRPPMPLPKEHSGNYPPRSPLAPGYTNGANNFQSPMKGNNLPMASRNLPPPPLGRPPVSPGHRNLPPPPPPDNNFGFRGGTRY